MYSTHSSSSSPTIFFCSICDKPFNSGENPWRNGICVLRNLMLCAATSRDRHLRYCGRYTRHRPRSCRSCNAAKTKCSFEVPCLRCAKRHIECVYGEQGRAGRQALPSSPIIAHTARPETCEEPNTAPAFGISQADEWTRTNGVPALADDMGIDRVGMQSTNGNRVQMLDPTFDGLFAFEDDIFEMSENPIHDSLLLHHDLNHQPGAWCTWMSGDISLAVVAENPLIHPQSHHLAVLQPGSPHAQHNANLIIQSLRSFPTMMLRRETFPWFIHPHSQTSSESPADTLPEALSNCMSIAQMFSSRTPETKTFLRQTMGTEYRRFGSEVRYLLTWDDVQSSSAKDL